MRLSILDPSLDSLIPVTLAKPCSRPRRLERVHDQLRVKSELRLPNRSSAAFELWNRPQQHVPACLPTSASRCKNISQAAHGLTEPDEVASGSTTISCIPVLVVHRSVVESLAPEQRGRTLQAEAIPCPRRTRFGSGMQPETAASCDSLCRTPGPGCPGTGKFGYKIVLMLPVDCSTILPVRSTRFRQSRSLCKLCLDGPAYGWNHPRIGAGTFAPVPFAFRHRIALRRSVGTASGTRKFMRADASASSRARPSSEFRGGFNS
jgi:hypothetical protein